MNRKGVKGSVFKLPGCQGQDRAGINAAGEEYGRGPPTDPAGFPHRRGQIFAHLPGKSLIRSLGVGRPFKGLGHKIAVQGRGGAVFVQLRIVPG